MSELQHGLVADSDLERVRELEKEGYHEDEAATLEMIRMRHGEAGDLFTGAWKDGVLIGFTNSTRTNGNTLTHDSMHHNDPNGVNICLHSVCVAKDHRRQGVARAMLRHLLEHAKTVTPKPRAMYLLSHEYLTPLYESVGFQRVGLSEVEFGPERWIEYKLILNEDVPEP
eukprot:m.40754 g.40754  ORF g.40754 m.40754 type:complete len:170 (-) comp6017_c0_seq3:3008-3517(-)